jgi:transposase
MDSAALPDDPATLKAMLLAERARAERLEQIIKELQRHRFGRRAETLPEDQLLLGLEDVEQAAATSEAENEAAVPAERAQRAAKRRLNRGTLPSHLPRIEMLVDIEDRSCPCCRGLLHRIGEDCSERLDMIPAQLRVLVVRRPKYACRACEEVVVQAPAPARLIEGGLPTEATVAQVLVSKYADHLPLYRQAQIYARQGITLDRSTLADWVGRAAFLLRPVHERLLMRLKGSAKLFADETTAPVLDPGRGRTKTGQLWAYARDDRPWGGTDPPGVVYVYAPDRKSERPVHHLAGFKGLLQVDGYAGYRTLAERGDVQLAFCWAHVRRYFYELAVAGPAPIAHEALKRIAALYAIEAECRGHSPEERRALRQEKSRPILDAFEPWLRAKLQTISQKSKLADAIRYALSRWQGLIRFVDDGCVEIDSNVVERSIRPIAMAESFCTPFVSAWKH